MIAVVMTALTAAVARGADAASYGTASNDAVPGCPASTADCPAADAFYTPPADLASRALGAVIAARPATAPNVQNVKAAYTVSYRSSDAFGAPVLGIATVFLPTGVYTGTGSTPLVSEQTPEDSLGSQCAPSYALAHPNTNGNIDADTANVSSFLGQGYVVVVPDHEGPAGQYIVGQQEGHATLDGIRAALALPASGLKSATPVVVSGYSGGAHATGWASELAADYAPDVHLVGVAEGGTPADLAVTGQSLDGSVFFGLSLLSSQSLDRGFPATGIYATLNATGRSVYASTKTDCVGDAATNYAGKRFDDYTTTKGVMSTPPLKALLAHEQLGQSPPHVPVLNYHVINDEIVPFDQDRTLVNTYCRAKTPVQYMPISGDHISGAVVGAPLVLAFLQARFSGAAATDSCPQLDTTHDPTPTVSASPATASSPTGTTGRPRRPLPVTRSARSVRRRRATVRGAVRTRGVAVTYRFVYRRRGHATVTTPRRAVRAGTSGRATVRAILRHLRPGRRYTYRLTVRYRAQGGNLKTRRGRRRAFRTRS